MDAFVLDVSACIPWCCEDETTASSEEMLQWAMNGSALHVPSLWVWEVLNTNPNAIDSFKVAVYATYTANVAQNSPPAGTVAREQPPQN